MNRLNCTGFKYKHLSFNLKKNESKDNFFKYNSIEFRKSLKDSLVTLCQQRLVVHSRSSFYKNLLVKDK
jgi:hypothetical protein